MRNLIKKLYRIHSTLLSTLWFRSFKSLVQIKNRSHSLLKTLVSVVRLCEAICNERKVRSPQAINSPKAFWIIDSSIPGLGLRPAFRCPNSFLANWSTRTSMCSGYARAFGCPNLLLQVSPPRIRWRDFR